MKQPEPGDMIRVITNEPNPHDFQEVEVTGVDVSMDQVFGVNAAGQEVKVDFIKHLHMRQPDAEPVVGEWAFGDDRDD